MKMYKVRKIQNIIILLFIYIIIFWKFELTSDGVEVLLPEKRKNKLDHEKVFLEYQDLLSC